MINKVLVGIREATKEDRLNVFEWFTNTDIADDFINTSGIYRHFHCIVRSVY
ncbi:MAG: hypothetical protein JEZ08_23855 [Clostridiales bacterium]|nr:hypothetical protein [Clostridiales bacterium]